MAIASSNIVTVAGVITIVMTPIVLVQRFQLNRMDSKFCFPLQLVDEKAKRHTQVVEKSLTLCFLTLHSPPPPPPPRPPPHFK